MNARVGAQPPLRAEAKSPVGSPGPAPYAQSPPCPHLTSSLHSLLANLWTLYQCGLGDSASVSPALYKDSNGGTFLPGL